MKMSGEIMVRRKWLFWVTVVMVLCAVAAVEMNATCSVQCSCTVTAVLCSGCPRIFPPVAITDRTEHILIDGCHAPFENYSNNTLLPRSLTKLSIVNSALTDVTDIERYIRSANSLILQNNSIETLTFKMSLPNITFLDLSFNRLVSVLNQSFSNLPNLKYLDLSKNQVVNMTSKCFVGLTKLQHLDMSLNNMTSLSKVFSPLISLQHLNLSWNHIELLPEGCFSSLFMLQHLDISYNRLTSVAPGALQFLPNLARLLLADNPKLGINQLDGQLLVGTGRRLQQVDASRTGLIQVPETLTHSVRFLNLAGNKIATIRCGDLDSYPLLQTLDFTDNVINSIEDDALGRLELLTKLHLNNNNLRTVPKMLPSELTELSLNFNMISNLTITDFINLPNLKILLLAKNAIYFIQENVFIQLFSLQVLDLSYNPIKSLTPSTLNGPSALRVLNLSYLDISLPAMELFFPVSTPEGLEKLELQNSTGLTYQFLNDTAVLAALTRLQYLDLSFTKLTNLRSDLIYYLSQLRTLKLDGNQIDCKDLNWLANWVRDNPNNENLSRCFYPSTFQHEQYHITTIATLQEIVTTRVEKSIIDPRSEKTVNINDAINKRYEINNYDKSNILRDISEIRDIQNNDVSNKYVKEQYRKPGTKTVRNNETSISRNIVTGVNLATSNSRRLVDFFTTPNITGNSLKSTYEVNKKGIQLKDENFLFSTHKEGMPTNNTQSKLTSKVLENGGGSMKREPQPVSSHVPSTARETNKTLLCGSRENKNETKDIIKCLLSSQEEVNSEKNEIILYNNSKVHEQTRKDKILRETMLSLTPKKNKNGISKTMKINYENKENVEFKKNHQGINTSLKILQLDSTGNKKNPNKLNISSIASDKEFNEVSNNSRLPTKASNNSKEEWSRYSDERTRSHPGALVALAGVGLCVSIWAAIHVWGRQRARKGRSRPSTEQEDIEVPSVHAPGGLW